MSNNTRGDKLRLNVQQKAPDGSPVSPAAEDQTEAFSDAVADALGTDLGSIFGDGMIDLSEPPAPSDLGMSDPLASNLHGRGQPMPLETPKPRQGFEQRLILFSLNGVPQPEKIQDAYDNHYRPRKWSSLTPAEKKRWRGTNVKGSGESIIVVGKGNLVLCERRKEWGDIERQATQQLTAERTQAVSAGFQREIGSQPFTHGSFDVGDEEILRGQRTPQVAPNRNV